MSKKIFIMPGLERKKDYNQWFIPHWGQLKKSYFPSSEKFWILIFEENEKGNIKCTAKKITPKARRVKNENKSPSL